MTKFRMLLVEEQTLGSSGEFNIEAETPEAASELLLAAHSDARDKDSNIVILSDGQKAEIFPNDIVNTAVFCLLLDDNGGVVRRIPEEDCDAE